MFFGHLTLIFCAVDALKFLVELHILTILSKFQHVLNCLVELRKDEKPDLDQTQSFNLIGSE